MIICYILFVCGINISKTILVPSNDIFFIKAEKNITLECVNKRLYIHHKLAFF